MMLPRWLDRERRIAELSALLNEARIGHRDALRLYSRKCQEVLEVKAERDEARAEVVKAGRELERAKASHQIARTEHFDEVKRIQDERQRWERMAEQAIVPAPSTPLRPDDRAGLYRLEQENERLRKLLDDERAAHDQTRAEHVEFIQLRHNPLLDEYLTERAQLIDKLAKYEGATP